MKDYAFHDTGQRAQVLRDVQRVVIKVGTRLLTDMTTSSKSERVKQLVDVIARLRQRKLEVILVSSGAVGAGMVVLGTQTRPKDIPRLQAHAAVGQSRLMYLYETACASHGFHSAQLLLTATDVQDRERHLNVTSCLNALLSKNILPIINENDSVSVEEICIGDNDTLAAMVGAMLRADLTVLLTTVDGMLYRDPDGRTGQRLSVVENINEALRRMAGGTDGNAFSTGGMETKLGAADIVTKAGEPLWIADGHDFGVLERIFDAADTGTLFVPKGGTRMRGHKRFLAFFSEPAGDICIDEGAEDALRCRGRSLLPGGIIGVRETFDRGDTVRILSRDGMEIARGVANYSSAEIDRIRGVKSSEIGAILGRGVCYQEVVHRDNLALTH